jgi:hypothetical protein
MALFCRANRAEQCPVSGVKQPGRRNPETAEFDPKRTLARIRSRNAAALLRAAIYNLTIGGAQNGTLARPASNF